jgi:hypothetical protein
MAGFNLLKFFFKRAAPLFPVLKGVSPTRACFSSAQTHFSEIFPEFVLDFAGLLVVSNKLICRGGGLSEFVELIVPLVQIWTPHRVEIMSGFHRGEE